MRRVAPEWAAGISPNTHWPALAAARCWACPAFTSPLARAAYWTRSDAKILIDATLVMLAIVIPTIALAFWIAWHYRASNRKAEYLPYWSYSGRIEAVVWSIPTLTIMFIGGLIWIGSYKLDPFRPLPSDRPPLEVQVVSRLEVAVHIPAAARLPAAARRDRQSTDGAGRQTGPLLNHVGECLLLRAAPGLDDLCHARHGLAVVSAGG